MLFFYTRSIGERSGCHCLAKVVNCMSRHVTPFIQKPVLFKNQFALPDKWHNSNLQSSINLTLSSHIVFNYNGAEIFITTAPTPYNNTSTIRLVLFHHAVKCSPRHVNTHLSSKGWLFICYIFLGIWETTSQKWGFDVTYMALEGHFHWHSARWLDFKGRKRQSKCSDI